MFEAGIVPILCRLLMAASPQLSVNCLDTLGTLTDNCND